MRQPECSLKLVLLLKVDAVCPWSELLLQVQVRSEYSYTKLLITGDTVYSEGAILLLKCNYS